MEDQSSKSLSTPGARPAVRLLLASLAISLILRVIYLLDPTRVDWRTFSMLLSDEGAHGIMAMHILRGARPVFYYGAYYLGALDAYVSAVLFHFFGESIAVLRSTSMLFSLACIPIVYLITAKLYSKRAGLLAASITSLPSVYIFVWGTFALCAYCTYTFFILLLLYGLLLLLERVTVPRLALLGIVAGLAAWNNQLVFPAIGVAALALYFWIRPSRQQTIVLAVVFTLAVSPLVYGNIVHPFATGRRIAAKVLFSLKLTESFVKAEKPKSERNYKSVPLLQVSGAQPDRNGSWSVIGILASLFLGIGLLGALLRLYQLRREDVLRFRQQAVALGFAGSCFLVGAAGFAGQPIGRYQIPLYPILAVFAAGWVTRALPQLAVRIVGVLVFSQAVLLALPVASDGSPPRASILAALREKGLTHGYGAGPMYDIVFRSHEEVIIAPLDHSRYLPYEPQVAAAPRIFYQYRDDQLSKPAHLAFLAHLSQAGAQYQQFDLDDHHVLFNLEPRSAVTQESIKEIRDHFRSGGSEE